MPKKKKTTKTVETSSTKVFDVARPGRVAASATSRPVIVGHKPQIKDPMMSSNQGDPRTLMDGRQKVVLEAPEQAAISTPEAVTPTAPEVSSMILGDSVQVEAPEVPTEKPSELEEPAPAPITTPEPAVESNPTSMPAPQATTQPQPEKQSNEPGQGAQTDQLSGSTGIIYDESPIEQRTQMPDNSNAEPLPVLPEEKTEAPKVQVVVSHHKPHPSGGAVVGWAIFMLLLTAVVLDILLDAGIITLSVPHTHFF